VVPRAPYHWVKPFASDGEGADHIGDANKMVTSTFVNLRARSYIRANVATRGRNNAVTSRLCHDFANLWIHEKAPTRPFSWRHGNGSASWTLRRLLYILVNNSLARPLFANSKPVDFHGVRSGAL